MQLGRRILYEEVIRHPIRLTLSILLTSLRLKDSSPAGSLGCHHPSPRLSCCPRKSQSIWQVFLLALVIVTCMRQRQSIAKAKRISRTVDIPQPPRRYIMLIVFASRQRRSLSLPDTFDTYRLVGHAIHDIPPFLLPPLIPTAVWLFVLVLVSHT